MNNLAPSLAALKQKIRDAAQLAIIDFEKQTGLTPSGIEVKIMEITTHGDAVNRYAVSSVTVDLGEY
jgi:hypothetical protein